MPARASKNAAGGKMKTLSRDEVMKKVIALGERERKRKQSKEYRAKMTVQQVRDDPELMEQLGDFKVKREVTEMEPDGVMRSIAKAILAVTRSILSGDGAHSSPGLRRLLVSWASHDSRTSAMMAGFRYLVPSRAASNTKYIDAIGRIVMGGTNALLRPAGALGP